MVITTLKLVEKDLEKPGAEGKKDLKSLTIRVASVTLFLYLRDMIKAEELRLGNWFFYDHEDARRGYAQIEEGFEIDLIKKGKINATPIAITPEVLESAGFEKDNIDNLEGYSIFHRYCVKMVEQIGIHTFSLMWEWVLMN
jgi:hypothetical protein